VVRVEAVGLCGSDTAYYKVGRIGDYVVEGPIVLGHEVSGQVLAVGGKVRNVAVGDRVAIEPGRRVAAAAGAWPGATTCARPLVTLSSCVPDSVKAVVHPQR
jgi:threonine dehydrogenase-like Zn-dependent dehydrogenase